MRISVSTKLLHTHTQLLSTHTRYLRLSNWFNWQLIRVIGMLAARWSRFKSYPDFSATFSIFPDLSLTTLEFPDFSRFSRWVVTLQAVVKANIQSNGNGQISKPRGSKTPEWISMKLGTCNYVMGMTTHTNLSGTATTWVALGIRNLSCFGFLVDLLLHSSTREKPALVDQFWQSICHVMFLCKEVSSGGCDKTAAHLGGQIPQTSILTTKTNRHFQA